jgi:hypothetical protein
MIVVEKRRNYSTRNHHTMNPSVSESFFSAPKKFPVRATSSCGLHIESLHGDRYRDTHGNFLIGISTKFENLRNPTICMMNV